MISFHRFNSTGAFCDDKVNWGQPGQANGVMVQDGWITCSYNALNQPIMMNSPGVPAQPNGAPTWLMFGFDPLGRCVKRWTGDGSTVNTPTANPATYFYYDGWNLIQEGVNANAPGRVYVHGARVDEIVASCIWSGNQWAYHHYDARGHAILLTLPNGNIQEKYEYDAFGHPYCYSAAGTLLKVNNRPGSPWGNRFLFTGREWLSDFEMYDFRNRLYQPELGRFMQPDPKQFEAGDYNLYRYCHNDPVNRSDPTGLVEEGASDQKPIVQPDYTWESAKHFDSANSSQGTFSRGMAQNKAASSGKDPRASPDRFPNGSDAQAERDAIPTEAREWNKTSPGWSEDNQCGEQADNMRRAVGLRVDPIYFVSSTVGGSMLPGRTDRLNHQVVQYKPTPPAKRLGLKPFLLDGYKGRYFFNRNSGGKVSEFGAKWFISDYPFRHRNSPPPDLE